MFLVILGGLATEKTRFEVAMENSFVAIEKHQVVVDESVSTYI